MRILKIGGRNLASLAGAFTVDFTSEPLASSGLFAISGPTGAGKSTLLDALCLALYDATPRLLKVAGRSALPDVAGETVSAQDTRTLLRRGAAEGYAEVEFVGNDGASYRARWGVRRSRTKAEGILQPTTMTLHQLPSGQALGGTKTEVKAEIEKRIGLSFEQFTRAVLLAQNEFATFLKTEDNERGELLETLTGSTVYSQISMRAYERARRELDGLQALRARLLGQEPLALDARAQLDADAAAADAALAAVDARQAALEQQLRWHQQAERLAQHAAQAQQAVLAAQADADAAAPRRESLRELETVQAARPLADTVARLRREASSTQAQIDAGTRDALEAQQAQARMLELIDGDAALLAQAEGTRRAAAPQLDQAKALDARIDAARPGHVQALQAREAFDAANETARAALAQLEAQRQHLASARDTGAAWLAAHAAARALAQSWPRWDVLFAQAGQAAAQLENNAQAWRRQSQAAAGHRDDAAQTAHSLATAAAALQALDAQRRQATEALAAFDAPALLAERQRLDARRGALAGLEKTWIALSGKRQRQDQLAERQRQLHTELQRSQAQLGEETARTEAIAAALDQAERSLKIAEAACGETVEALRASLRDDTPCPVCGAADHPYQHDTGALHQMLGEFQQEVARCRRISFDHIAALARLRADASVQRSGSAALAAEQATLAEALDLLAPQWRERWAALANQDGESNASSTQAAPDEAAVDESWFDSQGAQAQAALDAVAQQEEALRHASAARARIQQEYEREAARHAGLAATAANTQAALAQAETALATLQERRGELEAQLGALLAELDGAFKGGSDDDASHADWKEHWRQDPARFYAARQADSAAWLKQQAAQDERTLALDGLAGRIDHAGAALARAGADAHAARLHWSSLDAALRQLREERGALWQGRAAADVEAELDAAIDAARATLAARQEAGRDGEQRRVRLDEAVVQARQHLLALQAARQEAGVKLDAWLGEYRARHPDGAVADAAALDALLAVGADALRGEREALRLVDARVADAVSVLNERRAQAAAHADSAPADLAPSPQDLAANLQALAGEKREAADRATAHKLQIAQDEARRTGAQAMLAEIHRQEDVERRWARLNELIGSADGKKFRNYAQQFTLDVLLGYANAHLNQLARRYQLERIAHATNPSLGLMVRDQDMGGELRSVHSLSGGESFLVSLALALGLASLSSNRVRVESLFIDEGFGSLDSETLRVAMDALDGLQSMGRKMGVISHVQEMTERIATRILVQPSAGGRSTITVQ
jgi:exonuclease SbcC